MIKTEIATIPYKGAAPAMADLFGAQADLMCDQTTNNVAQIASGKVKAFAVTSGHHLINPALATLPTMDEVGLKGLHVSIWHGLYAPKSTPQAVQDRLNAALKVALKYTDFVKHQEALGAVVVSDERLNGPEHKRFVEPKFGSRCVRSNA